MQLTDNGDGETVIVSTLAGGKWDRFADGQGRAAAFSCPSGIAIDTVGNLYVAESSNNLIRKIEIRRP